MQAVPVRGKPLPNLAKTEYLSFTGPHIFQAARKRKLPYLLVSSEQDFFQMQATIGAMIQAYHFPAHGLWNSLNLPIHIYLTMIIIAGDS